MQWGRPGFDPCSGRIPWRRQRYPLQYSGLENSLDVRAWRAAVHGVTKSQTGLSDFHFTSVILNDLPPCIKRHHPTCLRKPPGGYLVYYFSSHLHFRKITWDPLISISIATNPIQSRSPSYIPWTCPIAPYHSLIFPVPFLPSACHSLQKMLT